MQVKRMRCKAAVQALQKADLLKTKVSRKCDLLNDSQAWADQQQLQTVYHQVLVLDLEYALDKKVEQELWTFGFKNHITTLQELTRDKKNPHRSESQALLSWCLEAASGFYLTLLHELCTTFNLDLPFRKKIVTTGQTKTWSSTEQLNRPQTSSCIYICQYCLVHLGDIARYRNQRKQAESFYKYAILLSPTSGQPYNQLALLEASQGDKLGTIFYYVRGIAVKNPFPATATNLVNTLSVAIDKDDAITEVQTKLTTNEFIRMFVRVHGLLYTTTDLDQAELGVKSLNATLTPLVATQSFTEQKLIQMTAINLYALKHTVGAGTLKTEELTEDENKVRKSVLDLLAGSLSAFLLPVYTLNHDNTLLDYYALPAIKFILYWLQKEPEVLKENVFQSRLQIWPGLCKLLNSVQNHVKDFDYSKFLDKTVPLSEDKDLQGFLPLTEAFKELDFKANETEEDLEMEKMIRAKRLLEFATWLTSFDVNNSKLIVIKENTDEKIIHFEPGCVQPDPTTKLLEEMKSFNISETIHIRPRGSEKRGGILKPQGSLEKSRKEQETSALVDINNKISINNGGSNINKSESTKLKRVSQNVALQSIFKKMEENKQVKFDMGNVEKEKLPKVENKQQPVNKALQTTPYPNTLSNTSYSNTLSNTPYPNTLTNVPYSNQQFRTNPSFGQNIKSTTNDIHQNYVKSNFQNFSSGPFERNPLQNPPFQKTDMPSMGSDKLSQNINFPLPPSQPSQHMFNAPPTVPNVKPPSTSFPSSLPPQRPQLNQQIPMPYQNMSQFSSSHDFNSWKQEERPSSTWWSNSNQPPVGPNYQQRDYPLNFPYPNNLPYMPTNMDFNKQQPNQGTNMLSPPWSSMQSNLPYNSLGGFDHSNQGLSLRQAMLKETKNIPSIQNMTNTNHTNHDNVEKMMQVPSSTPGYSLFNSNSWSPSLPGQYRSTESPSDGLIHNLRQQSLFSRQPPLQQLLERQNQLKKGES